MAGKPASRTAGEIKLIRELADILNETELSEIQMNKGDLKIRVTKHSGQMMQGMAPPVQMTAPALPATSPAPTAEPSDGADTPNHEDAVKSPMVGTAYTRPSPDADPFVKEGESVNAGDTILLVEAMKTFNPIVAEKSGTVTKVLVEDAQPVEFGEALFILE